MIGLPRANACAARAASTCAPPRKARRSRSISTTGFAYSDCRVDDSRLVVLNAVDASERGAAIRHKNALRFRAAGRRLYGMQHCSICACATTMTVTARALVNAAGPWAAEVFSDAVGA